MDDRSFRVDHLGETEAFATALSNAAAGEAPGFSWLWERFSRQVISFARMQGAKDSEGLTNDVFLAAFRQVREFEGDEQAFVSYLFAIARNKVIDERRRLARRPIETDALVMETEPAGDTEEDALRSLGGDRVTAMLAALTPDQRDVILLRIIADLPIREVAAIMERSEGSVKQLQSRALQTLQRKHSSAA